MKFTIKRLKLFLVYCAIIYPCTSIINAQTALANTPVSNCIQSLLYRNTSSEGFGGWEMQDVRTDVSEAAAVQACQSAR